MKKICWNCCYKGQEWKVRKEIPSHHCQHSESQKKSEDDPWYTVESIFGSCKLFKEKK